MLGESFRKRRSDKKRDVKPTIDVNLKDAIYRLSFVTRTPVKEVCEELCLYSINNRKIRDNISIYIRRDIRLGSTFFNGDREREEMPINTRGESERISLRLTSEVYEMVNVLAYGLDCSVSKACALLLHQGMNDFEFVNEYVHKYLADSLDEHTLREVEQIVSYVEKENGESKDSWAAVLSAMIDEVKKPVITAKEVVGEFLVSTWRDK